MGMVQSTGAARGGECESPKPAWDVWGEREREVRWDQGREDSSLTTRAVVVTSESVGARTHESSAVVPSEQCTVNRRTPGEQRESIDLAKSAARPGEVPIRAESRMVSEVASKSSLSRIDVHSWYDGVLVVARRSRSQFEARVVAVIVRM